MKYAAMMIVACGALATLAPDVQAGLFGRKGGGRCNMNVKEGKEEAKPPVASAENLKEKTASRVYAPLNLEQQRSEPVFAEIVRDGFDVNVLSALSKPVLPVSNVATK